MEKIQKCPRAVIFDLDGTLAPPWKSLGESISADTARRLEKLLKCTSVAIISSANLERIRQTIIPALSRSAPMERFYILPTAGGACYEERDGVWKCHYEHLLDRSDKEKIRSSIAEAIAKTHIVEGEKIEGDQYIDNESQIICALLGIDAPAGRKAAWDPSRSKRAPFKKLLERYLPEYQITFGGRASIEIRPHGVDKSFGVKWLAEHLGTKPEEMVFVGDAFYPGGNDYPVIKTGIQTIEVSGPEETEVIIDQLCEICAV